MRSSISLNPLLFLFALFIISCSKPDQAPPAAKAVATVASPQAFPPEPPAHAVPLDPDQALLTVSKALRQAKLLTRPDQCYAYRFDAAPGQPISSVDVRENHAHPECGGDPALQPHLFTVRIDNKTRTLSQDAHTPGDFQPLAP